MLAGYPPFFDENPFSIYEKILIGKIYFPSFFDPHAKDLVKKLLAQGRIENDVPMYTKIELSWRRSYTQIGLFAGWCKGY